MPEMLENPADFLMILKMRVYNAETVLQTKVIEIIYALHEYFFQCIFMFYQSKHVR